MNQEPSKVLFFLIYKGFWCSNYPKRVGANNRYGHPKESVLDILSKSIIYRTDKNGTIEIILNKNGYSYVIPSIDKEESLSIINERLLQKRNSTSQQLNENKHFVYSSCNEELATLTEYILNMNPDQISSDIVEKIHVKQNLPHHL